MVKLLVLLSLMGWTSEPTVIVGSKAFTESFILGELLAQKIEATSKATVQRKLGLGATGVLFEALKKGEIDMYAEYTGTISEAILKDPRLKSFDEIQEKLKDLGLMMSRPLGFNNTYALAIPRSLAEEYKISTISELAQVSSKFRAGFSHEFMARADGFPALRKVYPLQFKKPVQSMEHSLSYEAIGHGAIDVMDVYSTDAKINKLDLKVLADDLKFFPSYEAVILMRIDFPERYPDLWAEIKNLEGQIDEEAMRALNSGPDLEGLSFRDVVMNYLGQSNDKVSFAQSIAPRIYQRTKEHLLLVGLALLFSILVGVPLGIVATRQHHLGQGILLISGVVQTIPSLALLCFLVPLFGIGVGPALIALCLYGLLPVVMNTFIGIRSIEPKLIEVAQSLGLSPWQKLYKIELPLASRNIITGIRTSAVIGIGTATLAALIGAGGYGAPIVAGLAINDTSTILIGAVPAAVLALITHGGFEYLSHWLIPKGLK